MRKVTYSMSMSVDGYIAGPDGDFDWPGFTDDVFRISLDEIRTIGVHLMSPVRTRLSAPYKRPTTRKPPDTRGLLLLPPRDAPGTPGSAIPE